MSNREFFKIMWSEVASDRSIDLDHFSLSYTYIRDWFTGNIFDWFVDYSHLLIYLSFALSITMIFRRTLNAKSGLGAVFVALLLWHQSENYTLAHLIVGPSVSPQFLNLVLAAVVLIGAGVTVVVNE